MYSNEVDTFCIICFELYQNNKLTLICNHTICLLCYEKLLNLHDKVHCPICRYVIEVDEKGESSLDIPIVQEREREQLIEDPPVRQTNYFSHYICCSSIIISVTIYVILSFGIK
jgi:hypothetical protein